MQQNSCEILSEISIEIERYYKSISSNRLDDFKQHEMLFIGLTYRLLFTGNDRN